MIYMLKISYVESWILNRKLTTEYLLVKSILFEILLNSFDQRSQITFIYFYILTNIIETYKWNKKEKKNIK